MSESSEAAYQPVRNPLPIARGDITKACPTCDESWAYDPTGVPFAEQVAMEDEVVRNHLRASPECFPVDALDWCIT